MEVPVKLYVSDESKTIKFSFGEFPIDAIDGFFIKDGDIWSIVVDTGKYSKWLADKKVPGDETQGECDTVNRCTY